MPKFRITSPDGKKYEITAPDGTTKEQAYSMLQKQVNQDAISEASSPRMSALDKINKGIYDAGGWVTDKASQFGAPPEVAGALGYGTNVGLNLMPIEAGAGLAKGAASLASPVTRSVAEWLMNSALKPTNQAHQSGDAALAVKTMLDQGFNATKGGVKAMGDKIGALNSQIKNIIGDSPATINKYDVASRLTDTENRFRNQVNPQSDLSAIQDVGDRFLSHPDLTGKNTMPVQLAQDLKQGTQRQLRDSYGELSNASTEAQKGLARGLREEIGKAVPEVVGPLAQERDLIRTLDVAERRALMDLNKNPAGLSLLANNPIAAAGFMADKSALFKSLVARMINPDGGIAPATVMRGVLGSQLNQGQLSPEMTAY